MVGSDMVVVEEQKKMINARKGLGGSVGSEKPPRVGGVDMRAVFVRVFWAPLRVTDIMLCPLRPAASGRCPET